MRRYFLISCIGCTFIFTTVFFQNCGKYRPELNASAGYSVGQESIGDGTADDDATLTEIVRVSSIDFSQSVPTYSGSGTPVFSFAINNPRVVPIVSYSCKIDTGEWKTCSSPLTLNGLSEGMHTLSVKAVYKSVSSTPKSIVWTKDTVAPQISFNQAPPETIGIGNIEITFSATDSGSGIAQYSCLFDNTDWKSCTSPVTLTDLPNGTHSLIVRVTDKAGNINEVSKAWTVDPSYPYISLTTKPDAFITASVASFSFEVMNGLSFNDFECQFNKNTAFTPCMSGVSYTLGTDGQYTFSVRGRDSQGLYTSTLTYQFYRDVTPPKIQLVSPDTGSLSRDSLVIAANIDDGETGSGVGAISCDIQANVNGAVTTQRITNCSFPLDLSSQLTGDYTLVITAIDKLANQETAEGFQFSYINEEKNPAFLTFNLSGGAALMANVIPLDENAKLLETYSRMGMGSREYVEKFNEKYLGALWYRDSGLMKGIKTFLSNEAASSTRVYALPVGSQDSTSENPFDIQTYISSAGLKGTYVRGAATASGAMLNGINQTTIFSGKPGLELNLAAVFRPLLGFLNPSISSGYTSLREFPLIENYDPYLNSEFVETFRIDVIQKNANNALNEQIIYNSINGNIGPSSINFDGFNYHGVSRALANSRDETIGEWIGKTIQYAYRTKKKLMIYIPTDGSVASAESELGGTDWIDDRGAAGQLLFFVIDPLNALAENNYMIGNFKADQTANSDYFLSSDTRVDPRELAGLAVVANYLQLAGGADRIESVTQSLIKNEEAPKFIRVKNR